MAASSQPTAQHPTSHEVAPGLTPPAAPNNAPAPLGGMQPPTELHQGVQAFPQIIVAQGQPATQVIVELAAPGAPLLNPGTSPLHRSLYGRQLGN